MVAIGWPDTPEMILTGAMETNTATRDAEITRVCSGAAAHPACAADLAQVAKSFGPALRIEIRKVLDEATHWIPYAFGPVPVRSTSDVITHATNGLFGVIDVLPKGWLGDMVASSDTGYARHEVGYPEMDKDREARFGAPRVFQVPANTVKDSPGGRVREFVLFVQDGLGLRDPGSAIDWRWKDGGRVGGAAHFTPDCAICDDSYDLGAQGVNYRSPAYHLTLTPRKEANSNLNREKFPGDFFARFPPDAETRLRACPGETVVIRVIHPGGRARQHVFAMNGYGYQDLFPGFGFPHSALLGPGKSVSAWLTPRTAADAPPALWMDGPAFLAAGGIRGTVEVAPETDDICARKPS